MQSQLFWLTMSMCMASRKLKATDRYVLADPLSSIAEHEIFISPIFDSRMTIVISHNIDYGIMVLFDVDLNM